MSSRGFIIVAGQFKFDPADPRGAGQYDDAVLARVRPKFEKAFQKFIEQTVASSYAEARKPDPEKALVAAERAAKSLGTALTKKAREENLLDREFDQCGLNALKTLLKEMTASVGDWAESVKVPATKLKKAPAGSDADATLQALYPQFKDFARLDGYNVWRRGLESISRNGKVTATDQGESRQPTLLSWIVPVRQWAELESWGEDPKTKQAIAKPTHKKGVIDPKYLKWLRDDLKVFDSDATVKKDHLNRLDPDCLEALDFNLSAGRHKPFVFDAGQHRPPAELIGELQGIHSEVQKRLTKLLGMVNGSSVPTKKQRRIIEP